MSGEIEINTHKPDNEEVVDAISFMSQCQKSDLISAWTRISLEWDVDSVIKIHKSLCESGRIDELLQQFEI